MKLFGTLAAALLTSAVLYAQSITVTDEYVREVPPNMPNSAAFMNLANTSGEAVDLISGSSDAAQVVELHEHANVGGMMQMRQVTKITVPAHGTTALQPGGLHVMLIGLTQKLKEGENVKLTLNFSNGESVTVDAPIKKVASGMMKNPAAPASGGMKCGANMKASSAPAGKCADMKCGAGKCGQ